MELEHDAVLDIATGMGAKSRVWKNKKIKWSDLVKKLSEEHKTNETFKEFMASSKEEQGKIKDVGGFVGGFLRKGRRKPENVASRQILTLDIDFAHSSFWDDYTLIWDYACVLHATHKHSESNPRYRLIMPLSREVAPDEYIAIARKIAGDFGIDMFDTTTFQPSRLMFWPSNPKDVDYYFKYWDGPFVDADEVLDSYKDWTDSSSWPTADRDFQKIKDASAKQQDPEEKKGIVGAFCRTYTATEVIDTYLKDEYSQAQDGRYTYLKGSASSGLVLYDDKFAYSHHGTDPCSGKLCNVFDLVRIHKFGHLDSGNETNTHRTKSYKAMEDFAREDKKVLGVIAKENISEAKYVFAEDPEENEEPENLDWAKELEVDAKGKYLSSANNLNLIFANDKHLVGKFKENKFDNKRYVCENVPWRNVDNPEPVKNVDYSGVRNYIESVYGIAGNLKIDDSLALEFERHSFHPVRDYLKALNWDSTPRVEKLLPDYFGVEDNIYTREAIRKTLTGAVARVFNPGVKFDLVLTLVGPQGTGKSTLIHKLGQSWYSDTFMSVQGKEALEQIQGAWLIEMAELAGLRKAEVESVKHFISKQKDDFRPAYARTSETFQRQCIFLGTTNNRDFLRDPSGNRRFLPIDINADKATKSIFDIEQREINQIWAEAVLMYQDDEKLYLSREAEAIANKEQKRHSESDERIGLVEDYLESKLPEDWKDLDVHARRDYLNGDKSKGVKTKEYTCVAEIWCECLGKAKEDMDRYKTREINDILRSLEGWEQSKSTKNFNLYGKQKYYFRL